MRNYFDKLEVVIDHDNRTAKCHFMGEQTLFKMFFLATVYCYYMIENWQMHYLKTLIIRYQDKPIVKKVELNCNFQTYEDQTMDLV